MAGLVRFGDRDLARPLLSGRTPDARLIGLAACVWGASATLTIRGSTSMSMAGMRMPGGWTMSMAWMRMPGETWLHGATSFLEMWVVMMVAMMVPALVPMLRGYRQALDRIGARREAPTAIAAAGYFFVWAAVGLVVYLAGMLLATMAMGRPDIARLVPFAIGLAVSAAGAVQFTTWKVRRLADCREHPRPCPDWSDDAGYAWRHGLRLGRHCVLACVNLMALALLLGVMDLGPMAIAASAITLERLGPARPSVTRPLGGAVIGLGLLLIARAAGLL